MTMPRTTLRKYQIGIYFDRSIGDITKPVQVLGEITHYLSFTQSFKTIRSAFKYAMSTAKIYASIAKPKKIVIAYKTTSGVKVQSWHIEE